MEQFSLETSDEAEAIQKARLHIAEGSRRIRTAELSCDAAKERYLAHKKSQGLSRHSLNGMDTCISAMIRDMEMDSVGHMTAGRISEWLSATKNPLSNEQYFKRISHWCKWLTERKIIDKNPCLEIDRPKVRQAYRRRFLTRTEAERLLSEPCAPELKFALYCGLHAGMRKGEVLAAKRFWFDLAAGLLHITSYDGWHPKSGKDRSVPLTAQFRAFLEGFQPLLDGKPEDYVFRPEKLKWKAMHRSDFRLIYKRHWQACGIEGITFHDLRRTFASLHVSAGTPVHTVATLLGDTLQVTLNSYAHLSFEGVDIERAWRQASPLLDCP